MVRTTLSDLITRVGSEIGVSEWFEMTQSVIDSFARATGDLQWIHVDAERAARESPFKSHDGTGSTVAHGFLTLSLLSQWMDTTVVVTDRGAGINAGFNRIRFTGPVLSEAGSALASRSRRGGAIPGGAKLLWKVSVEREGQSGPVLTAEWLTRVLTAAVPRQRRISGRLARLGCPPRKRWRWRDRSAVKHITFHGLDRAVQHNDRETSGREALSSEFSFLKR